MKTDQGLGVEISRTEYFRGERGTLAYRETSPPEPPHEHQMCNCTKQVAARPHGDPWATQLHVNWKQAMGLREFELNIYEGLPRVAFYWDDQHATFTWYPDHIKGEIRKPGYGLVGCFFGNIYFGREVDTSKLMNNHSPSRIVDLSKIAAGDVWIHGCSFGKERMELLSEKPEIASWWAAKAALDEIAKIGKTFEHSPLPVDQLRELVEGNDRMRDLVGMVRDWFTQVMDTLETTDFYRAADVIYQELCGAQRRNF